MYKTKDGIYVIDFSGRKLRVNMTEEELIMAIKTNQQVDLEDTGEIVEDIDKVDDENYFLLVSGSEMKVYSHEEMDKMHMLRKCRNCGKDVSRLDYMHGRACPHCHKYMATKDIKHLYLTFNLQSGYLKYHLNKPNEYECGIDYDVDNFRLKLDSGDIKAYTQDDMVAAVRGNQEIYTVMYTNYEDVISTAVAFFSTLEKYDDGVEIYIHRYDTTNAILAMWYLAPRLKRFKKVYELVGSAETTFEDMMQNRKELTHKNLDDMYNKFLEIAQGDSYYRVWKDGKMLEYSKEDMNSIATKMFKASYLKREYHYPFKLETYIEKEAGILVSYNQALLIIRDLLKRGVIESDSKIGYGHHGVAIVDQTQNAKFRLKKDKHTTYTDTDYLRAIVDALSIGSAHYVYSLLDDNVVFLSKDFDRKIVGRESVANYIDHIAVKMQKDEDYKFFYGDVREVDGETIAYVRYPSGELNRIECTVRDGKIASITLYHIPDNLDL